MFKTPETLTTEDRQKLDAIMAYENPAVVARYVADHNATPAQSEEVWTAWKQFAATCHLMEGRKTTSKPVDDMWHTFLLHSRSYAEFCAKFLDGHFLHHEPSADEESPAYYEKTRGFAEAVFGSINDYVWPKQTPGMARCLSGGDCRVSCRRACRAQ
jgi:hypothetical protein